MHPAYSVSAVNGVFNYIQYGEKYTGLFDGHFIAAVVITLFLWLYFLPLYLVCYIYSTERANKKLRRSLIMRMKKINIDNALTSV